MFQTTCALSQVAYLEGAMVDLTSCSRALGCARMHIDSDVSMDRWIDVSNELLCE